MGMDMIQGDIQDFLASYNQTVQNKINTAGMPAELVENFLFESSIAQTEEKELYIVIRRIDGVRGVLRISKSFAHEQAGAEAQILLSLNHPALPKVLGFWQMPDRGYLVREYFSGWSLARVIQANGPLPVQEVLRAADSLADVLVYLHGQNPPVVHRDIKPQNIILTEDGHLKLIDFGIARGFRPGDPHDTVYLGTKTYAPPEQFGYEQTGPAADIYALGILMIYLSTGSSDRRNLPARITDKNLRKIIEKCIAFDPASRYSGAAQIRRGIHRIESKQKYIFAAIAGGLVLLLATGTLCFLLGHRQGYQNGFKTGELAGQAQGYAEAEAVYNAANNPLAQIETVNIEGNTPGNIVNGGLAVAGENVIYYSHGGNIWEMQPDGTGQTILAPLEAKYLNYYEGMLYCSAPNGIYTVDPQSGESRQLLDVINEDLLFYDGMIYFNNSEDRLRLYRMRPDGTGLVKMNDLTMTYYLNIVNGQMVFCDGNDGNRLYTCQLDGSGLTLLDGGECAWVSSLGDTIYYTRYSNNSQIMRLKLDGSEPEPLFEGSASATNAASVGIFFSNGYTSSRLYRATLDGNTATKLNDINSGEINVAGDWIFYLDRDSQTYWRMRTDGADNQPLA